MDNEKETPLSGCLFRIFWILVGPAILMFMAIIIAINQIGFPSILDIIYGVILILTITSRLADKPASDASATEQPPTGTPDNGVSPKCNGAGQRSPDTFGAERRAVKLYVTILPIVAIALWVVAHFVLSMAFK
jgi:hypothetical protein